MGRKPKKKKIWTDSDFLRFESMRKIDGEDVLGIMFLERRYMLVFLALGSEEDDIGSIK
jgi:hypothetical protein